MSDNAKSIKVSVESYKGVRDFYPEDLFVQKYIFNSWRKVVESFGYVEYDASILESAELYKAKSGEEIVNEQTYTFTDRGEREVTLRPEMTPTVARMVAARERELIFPLRWYSIPNLFRYEKPQRGRLREHWQLNVDLFGVEGKDADMEIINIASAIMRNFGAKETDFIIKINSRKIISDLYKRFDLSEADAYKISKLIDKKDKISAEIFFQNTEEILKERTPEFVELLSSNEKLLEFIGADNQNTLELIGLIENLEAGNIKNVIFDATLMRGFDYYTGIVFEVFDLDKNNNRSVFGGGRYDDLLDIFGARKVPAVGFGAGDVTARDFLDSHGLLPKYEPATKVYICTLSPEYTMQAIVLAGKLRENGINVAVDLSNKKVGDQIKIANKQSVPYIICIGENETKTELYPLKDLTTGEERKLKLEEITETLKK